MDVHKKSAPISRRQFLRTTTTLASSAIFVSMSSGFLFARSESPKKGTIPSALLNNGIKMPMLGFGTYGLNGEVCQAGVTDAISLGYRLFDTATIYGNEEFVGKGIYQGLKNTGLKREELFVTSKLWVDDSGYESTKKAFELSLSKLRLDYLDLYLIHRPRGDVKGTWKAMEDLYKAGKIKAIGLSNFETHQLEDVMSYATVTPTINQIETHAFFQQEAARKNLTISDVKMEAWAPFAEGRNGLFTNEVITQIGKKYGKTNAQISLRWHLQRDIIAIPRSSNHEHRKENLDIFDFELTAEEMKTISSLDLNITQFPEWE